MTRAAVALAVAAAVLAPTAAHADGDVSGDWWYQRLGVEEVHAQGWDGSGVKIAVVDGQINDTLDVFAGTNLTVGKSLCVESPTSTVVNAASLHGSDVVATLIGNGQGEGGVKGIVPGASVTFYGFASDRADCYQTESSQWSRGLKQAVQDGAEIVSISSVYNSPTEEDVATLVDALRKGVIIVAGTPNNTDQRLTFPAAMNGVVSVNAFDPDGKLLADKETGAPNVQKEVSVVAPGAHMNSVNWEQPQIMSGSSFATPIVTGIIAAAKQKYPGATSNQIIQSLIHNTTMKDHPLERDRGGFGYGPASLRHVLAVDPSQYPDVNPLMDKDSGVPSQDQVDQTSTPSPTPSEAPSETGDDPVAPAMSPLLGFAALGGVFVVAGAALAIVLAIRSKRLRRP